MLNEKEFIDWLKSDSSKPYLIGNQDRYGWGTRYIKINQNEEFTPILDYKYNSFADLESFSTHHDFELRAVYYPKINTFIFENDYYKKELGECEDLKVEALDDLYNKLFDELNADFIKRVEYLRECYKNNRKRIDDLKERHKDTVFKLMLGEEDNDYKIIYDYEFKKERSRKMIYDYLSDEKFVEKYMDEYLKNSENHERIEIYVCREMALEELKEELKDNSYIKKSQFIYNLLKNELEGAKKVWVHLVDGKKKQVENSFYNKTMDNLMIGEYSNKAEISEIESFSYSRKEYKIPSF